MQKLNSSMITLRSCAAFLFVTFFKDEFLGQNYWKEWLTKALKVMVQYLEFGWIVLASKNRDTVIHQNSFL